MVEQGNPYLSGGWMQAGDLPGNHWWPHIEYIATASDLWTYLMREFVRPDPMRNPEDLNSRQLVETYLGKSFDELEYVTSDIPNPDYDPTYPVDPMDPFYEDHEYDINKTHPYMEFERSGLRLRGKSPRKTLGVNLRNITYTTGGTTLTSNISGLLIDPTVPNDPSFPSNGLGIHLWEGQTPTQGIQNISGLEIKPDLGIGVKLLQTYIQDADGYDRLVDYSGLTIIPRDGLTICPANNSLVVIPGVWYESTKLPRGGVSVKLAEDSGLIITDAGVAMTNTNLDWPKGMGIDIGGNQIKVKTHFKHIGKKTVTIPNPNYTNTSSQWTPQDPDDDFPVPQNDNMSYIPDNVRDAWARLALKVHGIHIKDEDAVESPVVTVEGDAYEFGGILDSDGLCVVPNDEYLTIEQTAHDNMGILSSNKYYVLKARRWRDYLITTAMQIFNSIIELIEKAAQLAGHDIELPTIPDNLIDAWPTISDGLEWLVDGGDSPFGEPKKETE